MDIGKIVFAEIIERVDGRVYKFNLENGSEYATRDKEVAKNLFNEYASQYGLSVEDLMKDSTRVSLPVRKTDTSKKEETVPVIEKPVREKRTEKFKEEKKEKSSKLRITLSIVSATVIFGVGACHLIKNNRFNNHRIKDGNELIQVITNDDVKQSNTQFVENLNVTASDASSIQDKLYDMTYNRVNMTDEEFKQAIYEINMMSFANIQEISNYINGSKLVGDVYQCNMESIFKPDSVDYQVVRYFSNLKNSIVNCAYDANSRSDTKKNIKAFYDDFVSFAILNSGYSVSNNDGSFIVKMDDLTPQAKNCIYSLMSGIVSIDYNYKNNQYNRNNIIDYVNEEYRNIYIELQNKSVSK